uniref:Uncharacterized protein n=1 Tax=viral metagenome TaxID=1070528 RepID=A0A6M3JH93_9ZZZZ
MVILGSGNYLKTADVSNGDRITFKDAGEWIESTRWKYDDGNPKVDFVIGVEIKGVTKKMRLNKTNRDILVEAYDTDTSDWIGRQAVITIEKVMVGGKRMDCIILSIPADQEEGTANEAPGEGEIPF